MAFCNMMKKLMILGASELQLPLIKKAKELGLHTIVIAPNSNEIGFAYADESFYIDVRDIDKILALAVEIGINGIITDQAETPIRTVAYVAEKLNLPGIGIEQANIFTNKFLMREKLKQLGLRSVRYLKTNNLSDAISFYKEIGRTIVMKPIDSAGSRGVVKIDALEDLMAHFEITKSISTQQFVILEEYISGKELLIDGLVYDYRYTPLICGQYMMGANVFSSYITKYPAEISNNSKIRVLNYVKSVIEGFGLPWGRTHTEVKVNEEGVYLIETAARGGGRFLSYESVRMQTNINSEEFLIKMSIGDQKNEPSIEYKQCSCGYISMRLPQGTIKTIEGIETVLSLPYTYSNNFNELYVGKNVEETSDKTKVWFMHLYAKSDSDFYDKIAKIKNLIHIEVDTIHGIRGPIWE